MGKWSLRGLGWESYVTGGMALVAFLVFGQAERRSFGATLKANLLAESSGGKDF